MYGARKTWIEWICVLKQKRSSWVLTNCIQTNKSILKQKKKASDIFYFLYGFTFSRMSCNWHHAVYNFFQTTLFYLIAFIQVSLISFCDLIGHFYLFLNSILLCWCNIGLFIPSSVKGHFDCFLCVCVRERERECVCELSYYKIYVHVFAWALASSHWVNCLGA